MPQEALHKQVKMIRRTVYVKDIDAPIPLREYLMLYSGFSRSQWKVIKKSAGFHLNGCDTIASHTMVSSGDVISWDVSAPHFVPADMPLTIYYEDEALIVLEKPAGIVVHPTSGDHVHTIANALVAHWIAHADAATFHPVHRLDRYTSGLLLVAKHPETQYLLQQAGKNALQRQYAAICEGILHGEGIFDAPIGRKDGSIIEREVRPDGKASVTHYTVLAHGNECTLLRLRLETGRTHQIRVHLSHAGHPLLGDSLYGGAVSVLKRQALHAYRLAFTHPHTGRRLSFYSPLPSDMQTIFKESLIK